MTKRVQFNCPLLLRAAGLLIQMLALLLAVPAYAQPKVIGVLALGSPEIGAAGWNDIFGGGLRALGYKDGQSMALEFCWVRGDITRIPLLARELVERRAEVIVAPCGSGLAAIRAISRTLPVIALCANEKNFLGEIASLSRPGGYTTGVTFLSPESTGKRIELLRELVPDLSRLAILHDPNDPLPDTWRELERLQSLLGLSLQRVAVIHAEEFEAAFEAMVRERAQALYVFPSVRNLAERTRIAELARKHRIASVSEYSWSAEVGGLLSYGANGNEYMGKTLPMYVDKILRGAKPGDLPVLQPTQFELLINLKTAKLLGIKIPQSVLLRTDRVIE